MMTMTTIRWCIRALFGGAVLVAVPVYAAPVAEPAAEPRAAGTANQQGDANNQAASGAERAVAAAPAATQPTSPEARAVLEKVKTAYNNLESLMVAGTLSSNFTVNNKPQKIDKQFSGSFQAPNKFRHIFSDDLTIGSTGEKAYAHERVGNSYILADAPAPNAPADDLPRPLPEMLQTQNPSLLLAIEQEPLSTLQAMGAGLTKLPDVKVGDTSYAALGTTYPGGVKVQLLFDPKTHLLRRMTATVPPGAAAAPGDPAEAGAVQVNSMVIDYTTTEPAAKFPDGHFAWTPPEGATDIAAARPMIEQSAAQNLVGKPAPDFKLTSLSGETVSLADFKNQIVLLDFWATWCPPCVESLPHLGRLYGEKQEGVNLLAINLMEDQSQVQAFARSQNINIPILLDTSGEVAQKYSVSSIPQTVLIGPDGQVQKVFVGLGPDSYSQLNEAIRQLKSGGGVAAGGAGDAGQRQQEATPAAAKAQE